MSEINKEVIIDENILLKALCDIEKFNIEEFKTNNIDYNLKHPKTKYKQLFIDLRYLGDFGYSKLKANEKFADYDLKTLLEYFAKIIDTLRTELYFSVLLNDDKSSFYDCYREAEQYMKTKFPSKEEITERIVKNQKLIDDISKGYYVICESCDTEINYLAEKECAMGAIVCPNCKSVIDQNGSLLNKRYDVIAPDTLEKLEDENLDIIHKEAHNIWKLYELGKFKNLELLVNNHIQIVQKMLYKNMKHVKEDDLDIKSLEFNRDYDKDVKELLFKHEELHSFHALETEDNFFDFKSLLERHEQIIKALDFFNVKHILKEDFLDDYSKFISKENKFAEVQPSGNHNKHRETITIEEILPFFKSFKLRSPFIYLTGGVVNNAQTTNNVDILINCTADELKKVPLFQMLTWRLMRALPRRYWNKVKFISNDWQGPTTNNIPLYELSCLRTNLDNKVFEMSYKDDKKNFSKVEYDQTPYVLSEKAIQENWIPKNKSSGLLQELEKKVPAEYQYWKANSDLEYIKIRNFYVNYLKENKKYDEFKKSDYKKGVEISEAQRPRIDEVMILSGYLSCDIKDVFPKAMTVPRVRAGNYFDALTESTKNCTLVEIRNFGCSEVPPIYQEIQLKKNLSKTFLIEGSYFFYDEEKQLPFIVQVCPAWGGFVIKIISKASDKEYNIELSKKINQYARDNNMLKGEKFTISGEFIDTHDISWEDLKLSSTIKDRLKHLDYLIQNNDQDLASRGLLFIGPPGCGKTMTGKILSNLKPTFIWITSKDFDECYPKTAIASAFSLARELSPTVLFIEDIDSYIEKDIVDLMKTELDGMQLNKGIFTVLTSNFPERLPEALIDRPGRFHDVLYFSLPNDKIREEMFSHFLNNEEYSQEILETLIKKTAGFSGAHIKEICDFAKIIKVEDNISLAKALTESLNRVVEQRKLIESFRNNNNNNVRY